LHALGNAILSGIAHLAAWAIAGVIHAVVATTQVDPATVMALGAGPWRAMLTIAGMVAVPILIVSVTQAALRAEPAEAVRRGIAVPVAVGVGVMVAQALLSALLAACSWASAVLVSVGAGGEHHLAEVWGHLGTTLGSSGEVASLLAGVPGAATALLLLIAALAALTVWVELAVRAALLYLLGALVPLALAGLFWRRLASWAIRLGEVILAVALSQVVITAALVVGTTVVDRAMSAAQGPGATVGGVMAGVGLLLLASLGLPITLAVVPIAVDAAAAAGAGRAALGAARQHAEGVRGALGDPSKAAAHHRLATAPARLARTGQTRATTTAAPLVAAVASRARPAGGSATANGKRPNTADGKSDDERRSDVDDGGSTTRPVRPARRVTRPQDRNGKKREGR
jgi:hypothetical protein